MSVSWRWARRLPVILGTHVRKFPPRTVSLAADIFLCRRLIDHITVCTHRLSSVATSPASRSLALAMSSFAAFSFGAFGDFVAILTLAQNVKKFLADSLGASEEYQTLLAEVDSLACILQTATTATSPKRLSQLSPPLIQMGRDALKALQNILKSLEMRIITYQSNLRRGGSQQMMMASWRKIGWGLLAKDDDVTKLRLQLSYHMKIVQVVMSFAQR